LGVWGLGGFKTSENEGDWHNVAERLLWLIQRLRPALTGLLPPGGYSPVYWKTEDRLICTLYAHIVQTQCIHSADEMLSIC
jgi:hypothetical protein